MKTSSLSLLSLAFTFLAAGCQLNDKNDSVLQHHTPQHGHGDAPSVHGMLMFGDGPVYLSHLPMFHKPHDYQVLLEVELVKTGADPLATYVQDRNVTGEKVYTVVPEPFSLPELFTPANAPARTSFKMSLVRGHFERGGSTFMTNVTAKVKRVVLARKFDANPQPLAQLNYLLFGDDKQLFAAHWITKKPDFDHVVAVRLNGGVLNDQQAAAIRAGKMVSFQGVANLPAKALKEGTDAQGTVNFEGDALPLTVQTATDFYLETGDLSF